MSVCAFAVTVYSNGYVIGTTNVNIDISDGIESFLHELRKNVPYELRNLINSRIQLLYNYPIYPTGYVFLPIGYNNDTDVDYQYEYCTPLAPLPISKEALLSIFPDV